ncbi:hypothetical protein QTG54_006583 [Skeletonema marinoi]|uniref:Uncharacterized protein n=1 Tax=Skeletonema marinoi TaxID=267567 RepID=A0AAD8YAQ5_9STRA|nr:hypothetical protein QTG54_006583 [Skeletonema marinoi]
MSTGTPAPTPRPSKARKSSDAYRMFDYCAKSTKSPSKKSSKSPSKSPTAKSGKCKSSKAPTAAPVTNNGLTVPDPPAIVEPVEPETILESATTTTTTLVETPEPGSTAERPVYFIPGGGGGSASGGEGLSGDGGGTESGTEPTEAVSGSTAEGGVLFVEIDESATAGNSTVAGASATESSIAVGATTAENTITAGVTTVEESTLAGATAVEDSCVVEASSPADGTTVVVPIEYSAVMKDGTTPLPILDYMIAEYVAYGMFSCAKARARRSLQASYPLRKGGRALEELGCVGINSEPEEVATGESCDLAVVDGQSCSVVEGGVGLVISDPATEDAAKEKALGSINTAFSNNVFTDSNSNYYVPGLVALEMNQEKEEKVIPAATAATIDSSEAATAPISTAGAVVLSLGLIAFIALALMAFRHKRKRDSAYDEFDDDFDDLAAKETSSTDGSLDDILRDLDNAYGNQVDVHHCNSAMCQICNGKQTMFIDAGDNDTVSEMYPEQFEVGGADRNRSFEYTAKPGASSPRFDNPANIRPRLYEVEDTVDL